MVEPRADLSMRRQCELLGVGRSSLYYEAVPTDPDELAIMRRIDELHLNVSLRQACMNLPAPITMLVAHREAGHGRGGSDRGGGAGIPMLASE
jgi:hypothetical protein